MSHGEPPDVTGTVFEEASAQIARAYAEALVNAAAKEGDVDAVLDQLGVIRDDVLSNRAAADVFERPAIPTQEKDAVLLRVFEGRALPIVVRFLRVLNKHGRLALLGPITAEARSVWDRRQNRTPVTVRSASPLDEPMQAELRDRLAKLVQGTPIIRAEVDPSLIGGLVVQVGDHVHDASLRTRLERIRADLVEQKSREIRGRFAAE